MNVFILTDLEGIAGIDSIEQMDRKSDIFLSSREKLTYSLNVAIDACINNGAENVYFLDGHGGGGNVIDDITDKRAKKCTINEWETLIKEGKIDCQIELGSHARAGTIGGFLDHTISSRSIFYIKVNGREFSEMALHSAFCSKFGVPVVAVTGDETACEQAKEYIPAIYTGAVKKATFRNNAQTYDNSDEILIETISNALKNYRDIPLFKVAEPMEVEYCYYRTDMCEDAIKKNPTAFRKDARTIRKTIDEINGYADFRF